MTIIAGSTCLAGTYLCFAGPPSGGGIIRRELSASARASFTSVASGEGSRRSVGDGGQQRASFGASRTLRWKLDH